MHELETRIEDIHLTSRRLAEGLLLDAVEQRFTDRDIAKAARFYHATILRHEEAKRWREKVGGVFDFDGMDWGGDDPFGIDEIPPRVPTPARTKNKRG